MKIINITFTFPMPSWKIPFILSNYYSIIYNNVFFIIQLNRVYLNDFIFKAISISYDFYKFINV